MDKNITKPSGSVVRLTQDVVDSQKASAFEAFAQGNIEEGRSLYLRALRNRQTMNELLRSQGREQERVR